MIDFDIKVLMMHMLSKKVTKYYQMTHMLRKKPSLYNKHDISV